MDEEKLAAAKMDLISFNKGPDKEERARLMAGARAWVEKHLPPPLRGDAEVVQTVNEVKCRDPNCPVPMEVVIAFFWGEDNNSKSWKGNIQKELRHLTETDVQECMAAFNPDLPGPNDDARKEEEAGGKPTLFECMVVPCLVCAFAILSLDCCNR